MVSLKCLAGTGRSVVPGMVPNSGAVGLGMALYALCLAVLWQAHATAAAWSLYTYLPAIA